MRSGPILCAAIATYALAQPLPAVTMVEGDVPGYVATVGSVWGAAMVFTAAVLSDPWPSLGFFCGGLANVLFVTTLVLCWLRKSRLRGYLAIAGFVSAVTSAVSLWIAPDGFTLRIGCVVWLVSLALMVWAAWTTPVRDKGMNADPK